MLFIFYENCWKLRQLKLFVNSKLKSLGWISIESFPEDERSGSCIRGVNTEVNKAIRKV